MRRQSYAVLSLAAVSLLGGCDADTPTFCPGDLRWEVSPTSASLSVGDTVTATAEALGCGGTQRLEEDMRWTSRDSTIARVDSITGTIRAQSVGQTEIIGEDRGRYRIGPVLIPVQVTQ